MRSITPTAPLNDSGATVADVLGITVADPPEGWTPMEAIVIVKALNAEGADAWFTRVSDGLGGMEALGALTGACRTQADDIAESFLPDDGDEDDEEGDE